MFADFCQREFLPEGNINMRSQISGGFAVGAGSARASHASEPCPSRCGNRNRRFRQLANAALPSSTPYSFNVAGDSLATSTNSGALDGLRYAIANELMRGAISRSPITPRGFSFRSLIKTSGRRRSSRPPNSGPRIPARYPARCPVHTAPTIPCRVGQTASSRLAPASGPGRDGRRPWSWASRRRCRPALSLLVK